MKYIAVTAVAILFALSPALCQQYPDPPDPGKIKVLEGDIPHTLQSCNITATTAAELSSALTSVSCGQTICLAAQSTGASFTGRFVWNKDCYPNFVTLRSTRASELPSSTRVKPADAPKMAKLIASQQAGPIEARPSSSGLRMIGLDVTSPTGNNNFIVLGTNNCNPSLGPVQCTLALQPNHFVVDRCYVHGAPDKVVSAGVRIDADYVAVVNSYIDEIHDGTGDDQGILVVNSQGPIIFRNNFIHAAGENTMFGGGDPGNRLVPSDTLIVGNHYWKDPARRFNNPVYKVKNLFELKTGRRQRIIGNIFENDWSGVQSQYYAVVLKSANQGGVCKIDNGYYGQTAHLEFAYNKFINIPQGFVLGRAAACNLIEDGTSHVYIHDNLIENLGYGHTQNNNPDLFIWSYPIAEKGGEIVYPRHVTVTHNTVGSVSPTFGLGGHHYMHMETQGNYAHDLYFNSNIMPGQWACAWRGPKGDQPGSMTVNHEPAINVRFLPTRVFRNNLAIAGVPVVFSSAPNFQRADYNGLFVNQAGGDYHLTSTSAAAYPGGDGRPAGADITTLDKCTAGATSSWSGVCPGTVEPPKPKPCGSQNVIISQASIPIGANSVISAPPGWYGGTFSSSDVTKAPLIPHTPTLSYLATGTAAGTTSISGAGWTSTTGETDCALGALPLTVTALSDEVLVYDWNEMIPRRDNRYIEGVTNFNPNNQPVRYNQNRHSPIDFDHGTYFMRIVMGCMAVNDTWTWQINHWKGPITSIGADGEIYSAINDPGLAFTWAGVPITRTISIPLSEFTSHPDRPLWDWTTTPLMQLMGHMSNDGVTNEDRKLNPAAFPLDMRMQIVNVAQGGSFSGWSNYTGNGIGERIYDCTFPTPVTITSPANGSTQNLPVLVSVNAMDNVGITKVEFSVDSGPGSLKWVDNLGPAPYTWTYDPGPYSTGTHRITAKAFDMAGNTNSHFIDVIKGGGPTLTSRLEANGSTTPITVVPGSGGGPPNFTQITIDDTADVGAYEGTHHWSLKDINGDGKLDWIGAFGKAVRNTPTGQESQRELVWYQYVLSGQWLKHIIATTPFTPASLDVGGHGKAIRIGALDAWTFNGQLYFNRSNGNDWTAPLTFTAPPGGIDFAGHDQRTADIDEDGKEDIVYLKSHITINPSPTGAELGWVKQTADPAVWARYVVDSSMTVEGRPHVLYSGIDENGICDIDGDGHKDLIAAGRWYENPYPTFGAAPGTPWTIHYLTTTGLAGGAPLIGKYDQTWKAVAVKSWCVDIDGDLDNDIVQDESDIHDTNDGGPGDGRVGWLENLGGGKFGTTVHWIKQGTGSGEASHHDYHSLGVFDYDGDTDYDVVFADGNLTEGQDAGKSIFIMENTRQQDGDKRPVAGFWRQHRIIPGGGSGAVCHQLKVGDVDADGKPDMVCLGHKYAETAGPDAPFIFYKNATVAATVKLEWFVTGATKCEALASTPYGMTLWSGTKSATGGTQFFSPTQTSTYTISCSNATSTVKSSVEVRVAGVCAWPAL
jgi:hypothetical protein